MGSEPVKKMESEGGDQLDLGSLPVLEEKKVKKWGSPFRLIVPLFVVLVTSILLFLNYTSYIDSENSTKKYGELVSSFVATRISYMEMEPSVINSNSQLILNGIANLEYLFIFSNDGTPLFSTATDIISLTPELLISFQQGLYHNVETIVQGNVKYFDFSHPVIIDGKLAGNVHVGMKFDKYYNYLFHSYKIIGIIFVFIFLSIIIAQKYLTYNLKGLVGSVDMNSLELDGVPKEFKSLCSAIIDKTADLKTYNDDLEKKHWNLLVSNRILKHETSKLHKIFNVITDGLVILDNNNCVKQANNSFMQLMGIKEDPVGKKMLELFEDGEFKSFVGSKNNKGNSLGLKKELELNRKSIKIAMTPLDMGEKGIQGMLVSFKDVSDSKMFKQVQHEFITHVAHELKTPLKIIDSYCTELFEKDLDRQLQVNLVNAINVETVRVSQLIENMLNVAKVEMGNVQISMNMVKLKPFLEEQFNVLTANVKNERNCSLILPESLPDVSIDKELFRIVVGNLLSNAVKYTSIGDDIILRAEEGDRSVMIHFIDSGLGITKEELPHVFEKFYRSSRDEIVKKGGHGLGLSLVKEIIGMHVGEIKVISKPGEGTQFSVILPVDPGTFL